MPTVRRVEKMTRVLKNRQPDLTVICENIHDRHNVSAMLRTCDAVGIERVGLLYTDEAFPKLGKQSSASAKKWIEIDTYHDNETLQKHLKSNKFNIYATHLTGNAVSIYDIDWCAPSAIIFGNESRGVSEETLSIADEVIYIPMFGMVQSLNVSVATAVILYEACRQRQQNGCYPNANIDPEKLLAQLKEWKKK